MSSSSPYKDMNVTEDFEQKTFRKIFFRFMPLLIFAFVVSYIDRTNIGFASLTMNDSIGLSEVAFGWGAGVLFFSYCLFELPSNLALYRFGARRWLTRIMVTWGIISIATAFVSGPVSFIIARFLLGFAEAGFTPGVMFFLSCWFPARYRSRVLALFQLSVPLASLISGPLASMLLQLDGWHGLEGWQWLFIIEGAPAILLGVFIYIRLTDYPKDAQWLNDTERELVIQSFEGEQIKKKKVNHLWTALKDPRVLILAGVQFGFTAGSYGLVIWMPRLLKGFDLSIEQIGFLTVIPYFLGCVATIVWSWMVDKHGGTAGNLVVACILGALGLMISVWFSSLYIAMFGLSISLIGITSARGLFWSIPPAFLSGVGAAGGLAFINSIGTLGGFFAPIIMGYLKQITGSTNSGLTVMAGLIILSALLALYVRRFTAIQEAA